MQELFRLERRWSFQRFVELLFAQSGGMFEATRFAAPCEVSRQTIANYLAALEATFVAHVVRPYSTRRSTEIVAAPKVYGEVDFVLPRRGDGGPIAIECKWRATSFEAGALAAFRRLYPQGESFVVAPDVETPYRRSYDGFEVELVSLAGLIERLSALPTASR